MSRDLLIGQLRLASTGNEILTVLNALVAGLGDSAPADAQPADDSIDF